MSRNRLFSLLAVLFALAGVLSACGGGSDSSDENPQQVIANASLKELKSGTVDLAMRIKSEGESGGNVDLSLSGPFQSRGNESLPELDLDGSLKGDVDGEAIDFKGGVTLLSDRAFIDFKGKEYEVDPTTFGFVKSGFEQAQAQGGEGAATDPAACQEAVEGVDLNTVLDNLSNEGEVDVEGTSTTKVSGDLDPKGAVDALIALTEDPACSSQIEAAGPLPLDQLDAIRGEVSSGLKKAHVEVYVGDDEIPRKAVAEITVEPKDAPGEKVELELELTLAGVNENQKISAPSGAQPLEGLFQQLGVDPLKLFEAGTSGGLGGLLEGLTEGGDLGDLGGSGSAGEVEIDPENLPDAEASREYAECLQDVKTARDIQECASLLG